MLPRTFQTLLKHGVQAYFCGDTHGASVTKINGLWQVDVGHARGAEELMLTPIYNDLLALGNIDQPGVIEDYFEPIKYKIKKGLYWAGLTDGVYYKELEDEPGLAAFRTFIATVGSNPAMLTEYDELFRAKAKIARSTFIKVAIFGEDIHLKIYRDDARGGPYVFTREFVLN